jgi:hypothetical protein
MPYPFDHIVGGKIVVALPGLIDLELGTRPVLGTWLSDLRDQLGLVVDRLGPLARSIEELKRGNVGTTIAPWLGWWLRWLGLWLRRPRRRVLGVDPNRLFIGLDSHADRAGGEIRAPNRNAEYEIRG